VDDTLRRMLIALALMASFIGFTACSKSFNQDASTIQHPATNFGQNRVPAPTLNNNPQLDMILTNRRPILSVGNPVGMLRPYTLTFEISTDPDFSPDKTTAYTGIEQQSQNISEKHVEPQHQLDDGT
jgi:hypothetical protein